MAKTVSGSASSASEDCSSASDSGAESEAPVEYLVTGRTKRATAGNRIIPLLRKEQDDVDLIFEKEAGDVDSEEDNDFVGDEDDAGSDAQLDSSSDEEDRGPDKADDELEGERELQRQVRAERQKKRKAQAVFKTPTAAGKKVKVDQTAVVAPKVPPTTPESRPKKKSERISWIPTSEEGPVRASSRKQTMQNKETVHLRMAEKEKQRLKQMKHMEEAERKRQVAKAPPMTQAQRMAEAARTERKNAKSLNRWEEAEKQKAETLKAKLEALHNRQLTGPVISWWSGLARWVNGELSHVGIREIKGLNEPEEQSHHTRQDPDSAENARRIDIPGFGQRSVVGIHGAQPIALKPPLSKSAIAIDLVPTVTFAPPIVSGGFLDGIHYYASLPSKPEQNAMIVNKEDQSYLVSNEASMAPQRNSRSESPVPIEHPAAFVEKPATNIRTSIIPPKACQHTNRSIVEYSSRNLVALRNIDGNSISLPKMQTSVLLKKRSGKPQSQYHSNSTVLEQHLLIHCTESTQEQCAISGLPARFHDPKTGLAYSDLYAFKEIQRLRIGRSRWSSLLGCYVGSTAAAARGVPERFRRSLKVQ